PLSRASPATVASSNASSAPPTVSCRVTRRPPTSAGRWVCRNSIMARSAKLRGSDISGQRVLAEAERLDQLEVLWRAYRRLQHLVEGVAEGPVIAAETEGAETLHRLAVDDRILERFGAGERRIGLGQEIVYREAGARIGGNAPRGDAIHRRRRIRKDADARIRNAHLARVTQLDRTGDDSQHRFGRVAQVAVAVQAERIAIGNDEGLADGVGRIGEQDFAAAGRGDVHARGDDVEAPGLERGDQRAEFRQHALDLGDAELAEDQPGKLGRLAGEVPGCGIDKGVGSFVGEADAHHAARAYAGKRVAAAGLAIELARPRPQPCNKQHDGKCARGDTQFLQHESPSMTSSISLSLSPGSQPAWIGAKSRRFAMNCGRGFRPQKGSTSVFSTLLNTT